MKYLIIPSLLFSSLVQAKTVTGKVVSIHDGDTLTFLLHGSNKKTKLRLLGVDTPEVDFNGASQGEVAFKARDYLAKILPLNAEITVELGEGETDVNGRSLGKILLNGVDINLEMLTQGWGAVYFIFPYDKKMVVSYMQASEEADKNNRGIFSSQYRSQPLGYMFRQKIKGVPGTNIVADYTTKKLYSFEDTELVPHFHRVFFSSEEEARQRGFSW